MKDFKQRIAVLKAEVQVLNEQSEYIRLKYMNLIIYKMRLISQYRKAVKVNDVNRCLDLTEEN